MVNSFRSGKKTRRNETTIAPHLTIELPRLPLVFYGPGRRKTIEIGIEIRSSCLSPTKSPPIPSIGSNIPVSSPRLLFPKIGFFEADHEGFDSSEYSRKKGVKSAS